MTKLCATCAHVCGFAPMTCGKFRDESGNAKLCQPLRTWVGACGPDASGYQQASATGASIVQFPKAGRFA